jgi:hypothetical protein
MQPRTFVAKFTYKDEPWQILTVVYEDHTIHQAIRHHDWETWSPPLYPIDTAAPEGPPA